MSLMSVLRLFDGLKKFSGGWWWLDGLQVIIVSVHYFMPIHVGQDGLPGTQVYISLHWFMLVGRDMELNNLKT